MVTVTGHGGVQALAVARGYGVSTLFTLSGGHVFPLYDAAVKGGQPVRLVDVRHEQTAVFAAEATARLTRTPGLAAVTAGPGVTNSVSAVTTAWLNGVPVVVLAGRAPDYRWGAGSLQEIDHPPLLAPVTKRAWTEHEASGIAAAVDEAFRLALAPHRGPVFLDFLKRLVKDNKGRKVVVILDGHPAHRARIVRDWATANTDLIELHFLPGYSPDLNPIERLWDWMREEVSRGFCHASVPELIEACQAFIERINGDPVALVDRLWPKFELDPEFEEKLRVST